MFSEPDYDNPWGDHASERSCVGVEYGTSYGSPRVSGRFTPDHLPLRHSFGTEDADDLRSLNNSCIQEAMDEDMEKLQLVKAGVYSELDNLSEHPAYDMSLAHHQDVMGTKPRILIQPMSPLCADSEDHTDSEMPLPLPFGRRQSPPFGNNSLMVTTSYDDGGGRRREHSRVGRYKDLHAPKANGLSPSPSHFRSLGTTPSAGEHRPLFSLDPISVPMKGEYPSVSRNEYPPVSRKNDYSVPMKGEYPPVSRNEYPSVPMKSDYSSIPMKGDYSAPLKGDYSASRRYEKPFPEPSEYMSRKKPLNGLPYIPQSDYPRNRDRMRSGRPNDLPPNWAASLELWRTQPYKDLWSVSNMTKYARLCPKRIRSKNEEDAQVDRRIEQAIEEKKRCRMNTARVAFMQLVLDFPDNPLCWIEFVRLEMECGEYRNAREVVTAALVGHSRNEMLYQKKLRIEERFCDAPSILQDVTALNRMNSQKALKVMMEGVLILARLGYEKEANSFFTAACNNGRFFTGNFYMDYLVFEQHCGSRDYLLVLVPSILKKFPKFGPLWFYCFRLIEHDHELTWNRKFMLSRVECYLYMEYMDCAMRYLTSDIQWKVYMERLLFWSHALPDLSRMLCSDVPLRLLFYV